MRIPSGREYLFPGTKRTHWGGVTGATAIKNYPVQGFATADLVPLCCINLNKALKDSDYKSLFINTVHDNVVIDVYPGEEEPMIGLMKEAMLSIRSECLKRFGVDYDMPIGVELKLGTNWMEMETVFEC